MSTPKIIVTESDRQRLEALLSRALAQTVEPDAHLRQLRTELAEATVVSPANVPDDVITMNSTVNVYDSDFDVTESYTLVYPDEASIFDNRLSILNPMGTAILGRRAGDTARWKNVHGEHQLELKELTFQPEREGVLNL